jgi:predicted porin
MKKSMLALAVLGSFAGVAAAQSSVTLFGVVDLSARQVKNSSGTLNQMATDGYNSSRLGFRGVEDLGGGMRGIFWLESGLAADAGAIGGSNGAATVQFNRRSTVALAGNFGEVRLGRDYTPQFWNTTVFDTFGTNGIGSSLNVQTTGFNGATTFVRANNSFGYFLPAMGGVYGQVQTSLGENNSPGTGNLHTSFRLGYSGGPVNVAIASGKTKESTGSMKVTNVGGSFDLGALKLMGYLDMVDGGAAGKQDSFNIGVSVPMGQAELRASYTASNGKGAISTRDANQIAIGGVYNLSKRTALYGTYSTIDNKAGASYVVGGALAQAAGKKSSGLEAGVRHSF